MNEEIYYDLINKDMNPKSGRTGLAVVSLVFGILGLVCCCCGFGYIAAPISLILGIISLAKHYGGKGMAITGVILSAITAIFLLIFTISCGEYISDYFKFAGNAETVIENFEETGELPDYLEKYNGEEYKEFWQQSGFKDFSDYFGQVIEASKTGNINMESSKADVNDAEDVIDLGVQLISVQV